MQEQQIAESNGTTEAEWEEWRSQCAAERCCSETSASLKCFGERRFTLYINRFASSLSERGTGKSGFCLPESKDAWHLLESYCHVGRNRMGKSYKQWLFSRTTEMSDPVPAMEAGASLLMRDVVRKHLRNEYKARFMTSLESRRNTANGTGDWSLEELIPDASDPLSVINERELQEIASDVARSCIDAMDDRTKRVVVGRFSGIHGNDEGLQELCQCSKSTIAVVYRDFLLLLRERIQESYPHETSAQCLSIVRYALAEIVRIFFSGKVLDGEAVRFFKERGVVGASSRETMSL